jgi:peptidoglycan L-alanyl-D-glutamate endopeptidase CwlK
MSVTDQCRDLNQLHPRVKPLAEKLLAETKAAGVNLLVTETYRTPERQAWLYAQGRTRPGQIVTNVKELGAHSFRVAFDIVPLTGKGAADWNNTAAFKLAGKIGQGIGLEWGGAWKSPVDMPHFQYLGGITLAQYRSGKRPAWWSESGAENSKNEMEDDDMTQEQFEAMLAEAIKKQAQKPVSDWAAPSWDKAVAKTVFDGTSPQGNITREQVAAVLDRIGLLD